MCAYTSKTMPTRRCTGSAINLAFSNLFDTIQMILINICLIAISFIAFLMAIIGCASIDKQTNFNPIESNNWKPLYNSKANHARLYYDCGSFRIEAEYIPIVNVTYSFGPIFLPIIPIFDKGTDYSQKQLKLLLIIDGSLSGVVLSEKSVAIKLDEGSRTVKPISYKISYGQPQKREYYRFIFDIVPVSINDFTVVFSEAVGGCSISPVKYEYKDLGLVYDVLAN